MASDSPTTAETQFLREASNRQGRVAGHNNGVAMRLESAGLVWRNHRGISGQSNFLITDKGRLVLGDVNSNG